jgi:hypothetical protein
MFFRTCRAPTNHQFDSTPLCSKVEPLTQLKHLLSHMSTVALHTQLMCSTTCWWISAAQPTTNGSQQQHHATHFHAMGIRCMLKCTERTYQEEGRFHMQLPTSQSSGVNIAWGESGRPVHTCTNRQHIHKLTNIGKHQHPFTIMSTQAQHSAKRQPQSWQQTGKTKKHVPH